MALRDASQAKAMNKILPKLQANHKNIVLLPWSVYYKDSLDVSRTTIKRKIEECSVDCVDSPTTKNECTADQIPEKVPRISKG